MAALALAGVGLAISFASAITLIGDTSQPNRNFGVLILAQVGLAAAVGVALPVVDEGWGFSGIMVLFAVISVGNLGCARWLPTRGVKEIAAMSNSSPAASKAPVIVGLFAYLVFYVSLAAVWAFLELIANEFGISDARVSVVISSSLLIGGFGALGAMLVGGRVRPATGIAVGAIGMMLATLMLLGTLSYGVYFAAVCLFQVTWNFGIAFQLGLIATLDISGRFVVLSTAFATAGAVLGPALGGILAASTEGYAGPIGLGIAGTAVSLVIYLWCAAQQRRVFGATAHFEGAEDLRAGGT
jgi:predicted MFS family arabinose efflux permease